jgi:hypothetical protein
MKGPARYLLPNMVKNPSVPRTVIAKQLKLLEKSIEQRNPLLLARTRLPQPISDEREAVDSEQEYTESEAADYIANSPFMQDVAANPGDIRSQQQQISQPSNRTAPVRPVPVAAIHQPSPAATDSAENTPMFHKTPARFTASRPLPPPPKPVNETAASMTTPAAAAEMNDGEVAAAAGPAARTAEAGAAPAPVAPRKKQPLGVWRPSDADLGYGLPPPPPPPKPQQTEPDPRRGKSADKSAAVPSTNRYQYRISILLSLPVLNHICVFVFFFKIRAILTWCVSFLRVA